MNTAPLRFPTPPTEYDIRKFLDYIKETGAPENYPLISHTEPPRDQQHQICCNIYVPRRKRPGEEFIPCASCKGRLKFLEGHLLWSGDGALRLVGNTCGPRHFGEYEFRKLLDAADNRRSLFAVEEYLLSTLPEVPVMLSKVGQLPTPAHRFKLVNRALRRNAPDLARELWRIHVHENDQLSVVRRASSDTAQTFRSSLAGC